MSGAMLESITEQLERQKLGEERKARYDDWVVKALGLSGFPQKGALASYSSEKVLTSSFRVDLDASRKDVNSTDMSSISLRSIKGTRRNPSYVDI